MATSPDRVAVSVADDRAVSRIKEIFALINMADLPAMSPHVQELVSLASDSRASSDQLARVILKDYSLTNKVLQLVNSAYYGLSQKVSSISRAVTIIGFETVRNMACGIALFEDFVNSGVERDGISRLMTRSFLAGMWARSLCGEWRLKVQPEEAFICSLLRNLGQVILCLHLPDIYQAMEEGRNRGLNDEEAAWNAVGGIGAGEIGQEVARFWNMSDKIVAAMEVAPPLPGNPADEISMIRCLADFSNRFVERTCADEDVSGLFSEYGGMFGVSPDAGVEMLLDCVDEAAGFSRAVRYGIGRLKIKARLVALADEQRGRGSAAGSGPGASAAVMDRFERDMAARFAGGFEPKEFFKSMTAGIHEILGFDGVVCGLLRGGGSSLLCRFFRGPEAERTAALLEDEFRRPDGPVGGVVTGGRGMVCADGAQAGFSPELSLRLAGQKVYLLPFRGGDGAAGLLFAHGGAAGERAFVLLRRMREYAGAALRVLAERGRQDG